MAVRAPALVVGNQEPRVATFPDSLSSLGSEATELCEHAGLHLDPWQQLVLDKSLSKRADGKWAAFEIGLNVARQNGKGAILEARELAGLFLLRESFIIHSAHQFDTSLEAFYRLFSLIEETPDLKHQVKKVSFSHGEEGLTLKSGPRIRFRTRTKGGGRGFSCDCLILDEAMFLQESAHGALLPTLSAKPNPQVWYTGSAVDQLVHDNGIVFARIRERGQTGDDSLAYFEWSVDAPNPVDMDDGLLFSVDEWARANPGLGIRISDEHIGYEMRSMDRRTFAVERLGVGDWPRTDGISGVFDIATWEGLVDSNSKPKDPVTFAFDVNLDRSRASIAVAGRRSDGLLHIEVVDRRAGTGWLVERLVELNARHKPQGIVCEGVGPAASLLPDLEKRDIRVTALTATEHAQSCGMLFDAVEQRALRHLGQPELTSAVKGAAMRTLGDAWAWSRRNSSTDISPLVACTLASWLVLTQDAKQPMVAFS